MTRRAAAIAAAVAVIVAACAAASPAPRAGALPPAVQLTDACTGGPDADFDGLADGCEAAFAATFAPLLAQDPRDCEWTAHDDGGRIAGGYLHAVQRVDSVVRIAYLPAYLTDCGWDGAKCLLPGVDCRPHAGDSETIVVEARRDAGGWVPSGVFLSAHCFDGDSDECRWYRGQALHEIEWSGAHPVVWVSAGRHANYPSSAACDRGHHRLDSCDFERASVAFPIDAGRNIGSAAAPAHAHGCVPAPGGVARPVAGGECFWTADPFAGWSADAPGATPYLRYLDEVAGFVAPLDRLAWLAGCWQRSGDGSITDEQWMAPRGSVMLGMGRVVRDGALVAHEAMRIEARGDTLVFVANPSGQAEAEFRSTSIADDGVVFENPAHDFPQRVIYRHAPGDSLHARIEGLSDGEETGIDFRMGRSECGS